MGQKVGIPLLIKGLLFAIIALAITAFALLPQLTGFTGFGLQIEEGTQEKLMQAQEGFEIALTNISNCANITAPNETYQLNTSLTGVQSGRTMCIDVQANNTVIDCQGNQINGTGLAGTTQGISFTGLKNITIKNCVLTRYSDQIKSTNSNNVSITNNTFRNATLESALFQVTGSSTHSNYAITNNIIRDWGSGVGLSFTASAASTQNISSIVVEGNTFIGSSGGFNIALEVSTISLDNDDFANSAIKSNNFSRSLIYFSGSGKATNLTIYNNTFSRQTSCVTWISDLPVNILNMSYNICDNIQGTGGAFNGFIAKNAAVSHNTFRNNQSSTSASTGMEIDNGINVTIFNNSFVNYTDGIKFSNVTSSNISSNSITQSTSEGISINDANLLTISDNVINNTDTGVHLAASGTPVNNSLISNNTISDAVAYGIRQESSTSTSYNNTIELNNLRVADVGLSLLSAYNITARNNNISNVNTGIELASTVTGSNFAHNVISNASAYGIISPSSLSNYTNNTIQNSGTGLRLSGSDNIFMQTTLANNSVLDMSDATSGVGNLYIDTVILPNNFSANMSDVDAVNGTAFATPAGQNSLEKFLNFTNTTEFGFVVINWTYGDAELGSINESALKIFRDNGTITEVASSVDTATNIVSATITDFGSLFGIFGENSSVPAPPSTPTSGGATPSSGGPRSPRNVTPEPLSTFVFNPAPSAPPVPRPEVIKEASSLPLILFIIVILAAVLGTAYAIRRQPIEIAEEAPSMPVLPTVPERLPKVERPEILFREKPITAIPRMTEKGLGKYPEIIVVHTPAWQRLEPVFKAVPHKHVEKPEKKLKNKEGKNIKRKRQYG